MENSLESLNKDELNAQVRVEWLKSRARARSGTEEVTLLAEEKRRTVAALEAEAEKWMGKVLGWDGLFVAAAAGVRAYTHRQADVHRRLVQHFRGIWSRPFKAQGAKVPDRIEMVDVAEEEESEDEENLEAEHGLAVGRALAINDDDPTLDD